MEHTSNTIKGLQNILLCGPLIAVPFMLLFDTQKVYWNSSLKTDILILRTEPQFFGGYRGDDHYDLKGTNKINTFKISGDAFKQIKKNETLTQEFTSLSTNDTLQIQYSASETNISAETIRIVGLVYKGQRFIDPKIVYENERAEIYFQFGLVLLMFFVGLIWKLADKRKLVTNVSL